MLLLAVETVFNANTPRAVLFPDLSGENSDEFDYGDIDISAKSKHSHTNFIKSIHTTNKQMLKFRIDSTDVPCVNTTMFFCEEVTDQAYPKQYVETILANADAQTYENFFNKTQPNENLELRLAIDKPIELCESFKRIIHPQLAMNVQRKWHFVINQPSYQQAIHVEICRRKKSKCLFDDTDSSNYVSSCVQKYTKMPLLSLGEDGQMVSYEYEFPAYCQCEIQRKKHTKNTKHRRY